MSRVSIFVWKQGGGPRVVVSTAAFQARVRGSVPNLGGLKEPKMFLPHPRVKLSIVGSLRDREVACSSSDRQLSNLVSGGQCHLIHFTILRRFSWPSLAYMCTFASMHIIIRTIGYNREPRGLCVCVETLVYKNKMNRALGHHCAHIG